MFVNDLKRVFSNARTRVFQGSKRKAVARATGNASPLDSVDHTPPAHPDVKPKSSSNAPGLKTPYSGRGIARSYARLLASNQEAEDNKARPAEMMHAHLDQLISQNSAYRAEYEGVADQLRFASSCADMMAGSSGKDVLTTLENHAQTVLQQAQRNGRALCNLEVPGHGMMLEIEKNPDAAGKNVHTYTMRVYNTGSGLTFHARRGNKYFTAFEVSNINLGDAPNQLGKRQLAQLLRYSHEDIAHPFVEDFDAVIKDMYSTIAAKGIVETPTHAPAQAAQKVGNCTHKCVLAYMRRNLSDPAYNEARATLLENAAADFSVHVAAAQEKQSASKSRASSFINRQLQRWRQSYVEEDIELRDSLRAKAHKARNKADASELGKADTQPLTESEDILSSWHDTYRSHSSYVGQATSSVVEAALDRQPRGANPYLLSFNPTENHFVFSYRYGDEPNTDIMHYPMTFDANTREFSAVLGKGEVRAASPERMAAILVERAKTKLLLTAGRRDALQ